MVAVGVMKLVKLGIRYRPPFKRRLASNSCTDSLMHAFSERPSAITTNLMTKKENRVTKKKMF